MASGFFEACVSNALATMFVDYLVKPIVRQLGFMFRFNKIVKDFGEQRKQLTLKQVSVEDAIQDAKNQNQKIDVMVEDWWTTARKLQQEAGSLEVNIQENKKCFNWCPNLCWRYQLSKQAAKKSVAISDHVKKSEFQYIGHPAELPDINLITSKDVLLSKSADLAKSQIMEALNDDGVNIIGVWGMGGVGKTTLVNEVGRKAKESKHFDKVLNVVVSQNQNIEKIQDRVAESLNLTLDKKSEVGKAEQLWVRLQNEKSILIIIDDLWKKLDLKAVGIPIGEHHKGCKILLTSRSQKVCSLMESEKVVRLDVLDKDEAWHLFQSCAALNDDTSPGILKVAAEVAKECKGLPIALSSLGKSLKGANLNEWSEAIRKLRMSRLLEIECVEEDKNAYKCLKLSYDFLRHEETKICFLMCSLYPEDSFIPVEELVRHVWGLELFQGVKSIQEARNAVFTAVDNLKASSLLLDTDVEKTYIKMHDMVRDVALWTASQKENPHFVIKSEFGARGWPRNENLEHYTTISFTDCNIKRIPRSLYLPHLEFLSFGREEMMKISGASFEGMKSLKVLDLNNIMASLSQDTFEFLTNLRTLYLEYCNLKTYNISSLGKLKKLEILSLSGSDIEVLPDEVGELKSLRLLDLSLCSKLKRIPPNVIRRLSQLEELYLSFCGFDEWLIDGTDAEVGNGSLLELNELPHLTILALAVRDSRSFPTGLVFPKLQNYEIAIESYSDTRETYSSHRWLKINKIASLHAFENLFEDVELLELGSIGNCQNLVPSLDQGGLNSLIFLRIRSCEDMGCLIDLRKQNVPTAFSNLLVLKIKDMDSFQQLCYGPSPNGFLKRLETIKLKRCCSMKSLFPLPLMQSLMQLKSVKIAKCDMMEQVFEEIKGANIKVLLPKLESLEINDCDSLKSVFPSSVMQSLVQLKRVRILRCHMLEQIFEMEGANCEVLQKLESLEIFSCGSMKSLFPLPVAKNLVQLKSLEIFHCDMLEQIFKEMEVVGSEILLASHVQPPYLLPELESLIMFDCAKLNLECLIDTRKQHFPVIALSNLKRLRLVDMTSLKLLFNGKCPKGFLQKLKSLEIDNCSCMTSLFPSSFAQNLVQLKELCISSCNMLERLVMDDFDILSNKFHHRTPCFQKLEILQIRSCSKLEYVFPSSLVENLPRLKHLHLERSCELKQVLGPRKGMDENDACLKLQCLEVFHLSACPKLGPFTISSQMEVLNFQENSVSNIYGGSKLCNQDIPQSSSRENSSNMEYAWIGTHVEEMFQLQDGHILSNLSEFEVKKLPELRVIWRSPNQIVTLQNLTQMTVFNCKKLKYVFSPMLARTLPQLHSLRIKKCEDLEQIIDTTSSSGYPDLQSICFPTLHVIIIERCNNLKYVFPVSIVHDVPELGAISISRASKLEQVFGCEDKADAKDDDQGQERVELPRLTHVILEKLPTLKSFSSVDYQFIFPSSIRWEVDDCPQMTITTSLVHHRGDIQDCR
ncbi:Disease resistance protein [Corchorus capsularis]|uniref:Disease resistance protein n=1 Tax=Corchorus capsularis TaxID=210143 RepID=A0A1R3IGN6_COCAP|nr:Disease resistance protein [Corchorus capsularis]